MTDCFGCKGILNNNQCTQCGQAWQKCNSCDEMSVRTVMESHGSSYDEVDRCQNTDCEHS